MQTFACQLSYNSCSRLPCLSNCYYLPWIIAVSPALLSTMFKLNILYFCLPNVFNAVRHRLADDHSTTEVLVRDRSCGIISSLNLDVPREETNLCRHFVSSSIREGLYMARVFVVQGSFLTYLVATDRSNSNSFSLTGFKCR